MTFYSQLFAPEARWRAVAARNEADPAGAWGRLLARWLLGAAGGTAAIYVGTTWLTVEWNDALGYRPAGADRFDPVAATLLALLLAPVLLAIVYLLLGRMFRLPVRPLAAFSVALIGATPVYLAALTLFFMPAVLLLMFGLFVSIFWWAQGVRALLAVPERDVIEFNVIALLLAGVALQFAGSALGALY
jgi:hypothetical protein